MAKKFHQNSFVGLLGNNTNPVFHKKRTILYNRYKTIGCFRKWHD